MLRRAAALGLMAALLLSGCSPHPKPTPEPSPAPSPTYTCTTATAAQPCTAEKAREEKDQAAAVTSSIKSYTAFLAEYNRVARAGGSDQATPVMELAAAGPYLTAYTGFVREIKRNKQHYSGGIVNTKLEFLAGEHRTQSPVGELAFSFCLDGRQNIVYDAADKKIDTGVILSGKVYFRSIDNEWKIWDDQDQEVAKCPPG